MPEEMLAYDFFAEAYGWTPAQTDDISVEALYWLPVISEAKARVRRMREAEQRNSQRG